MQRTDYANGVLNIERTALLEQVPNWTWSQSNEDIWMNNYSHVKQYMQGNGKVPTSGSLGKWAGHQRELFKATTLSEQRVTLLNQL